MPNAESDYPLGETAMFYLDKNRMIEEVRALRHLPPNIALPKLSDPFTHALFAGLLQLSGETDPIEWLRTEHPAIISRVLLWTALDRLNSLIRAVDLAGDTNHVDATERYRRWLGTISPEAINILHKLRDTSPITVSGNLLRNVYRDLLNEWQGPESDFAEDEILMLIQKLYALDSKIDPLEWLARNEGELAAVITLRYLLSEVRQSLFNITEQKIVKVATINKRIRLGRISVELEKIHLLEAGFIFFLSARLPIRLLKITTEHPWLIHWEGLERVTDNLGNHYVIFQRLEEGGKRLLWIKRSLHLIGFPTFVSRAEEVTLSINGMSFIVQIFDNQNWKSIQEINVGDLSWQISLENALTA